MSNIDKQASQVSRYDLVSGYMQKWPDGEFVYHSDYQALLDELEAKDKRLNEILKPNMLLPVIDDMDEDNLRHVIKTVCENYSLLHAKWEAAGNRAKAAERRIAELEAQVLSNAAADVLAERQRQQSIEGWTPKHDDQYEDGELIDAAACYAKDSSLWNCAGEPSCDWPWPDEWWKPSNDMRRNLIKAGALILAEIERRDRATAAGKGE